MSHIQITQNGIELKTPKKDFTYENFEQYLYDQYDTQDSMVLDDDIEDATENWVESLDLSEVMLYADKYALVRAYEASMIALQNISN